MDKETKFIEDLDKLSESELIRIFGEENLRLQFNPFQVELIKNIWQFGYYYHKLNK